MIRFRYCRVELLVCHLQEARGSSTTLCCLPHPTPAMDYPSGPPNIAPTAPPAEYPFSSALEEETDTGVMSGPNELEPQPGLGAPVRCESPSGLYVLNVLNERVCCDS